MDLSTIDWEKVDGLLPVIVQEDATNEVLMLAYMNEEALTLSLQTNQAHYFSRTKQRIWRKGEESGNTQTIKSFLLDCDQDTLVIKVDQIGPACHTGKHSCFFTDLESGDSVLEVEEKPHYSVVDELYHTILSRKGADPKSSYTASLLAKGDNSMLKKVVEEAGEFSFAIKDNDKDEIIYEAADLLYHTLVAMASKNVSPDRVKQEIARRFGMSGIEEKNSRTEK
jgi:phosphoribosyl-ATP pyrophosphohydrolase/phosphoribosyl-AMP cyclohydrolase